LGENLTWVHSVNSEWRENDPKRHCFGRGGYKKWDIQSSLVVYRVNNKTSTQAQPAELFSSTSLRMYC